MPKRTSLTGSELFIVDNNVRMGKLIQGFFLFNP